MLKFGKSNGFEQLTTSKFSCDEDAGWKLAALAVKLVHAEGAYRACTGSLSVFMTFGVVSLGKIH